MFGDLGGLKEALFLIVSLIFTPIAEHQYSMKAVQKLYLAKSSNKELFKEPTGQRAKKEAAKKARVRVNMSREE